MFTYTFCHPASTTLPIDKLSFVSSLGTLRISLPPFWTTFYLLVGLQSAIFSVSAPAARSLLPVFMQATCLCSGDTEPIYWLYCRNYLHLGVVECPGESVLSSTLPPHPPNIPDLFNGRIW